jgi:hypothetical protein
MARKRHQRAKHERIYPWPDHHPAPEEVAEKASYVGSSEHKDYESAAGPPALRSGRPLRPPLHGLCPDHRRAPRGGPPQVLGSAV